MLFLIQEFISFYYKNLFKSLKIYLKKVKIESITSGSINNNTSGKNDTFEENNGLPIIKRNRYQSHFEAV